MDNPIRFGKFEFPRISQLEYLQSDERDYLFVNDSKDGFSMYFEEGFPQFSIPEKSKEGYCLLEIKKPNRKIKFFCPERQKVFKSEVWYFYVELFDENGVAHGLPGQVRVSGQENYLRLNNNKPKYLEVLEKVTLHTN